MVARAEKTALLYSGRESADTMRRFILVTMPSGQVALGLGVGWEQKVEQSPSIINATVQYCNVTRNGSKRWHEAN
jgi:hypothetical protein